MKSIRISDEAYDFLSKIAIDDKRSIIATLDLFIALFKGEDIDEQMERKSLPSTTQKSRNESMVKVKKKSSK